MLTGRDFWIGFRVIGTSSADGGENLVNSGVTVIELSLCGLDDEDNVGQSVRFRANFTVTTSSMMLSEAGTLMPSPSKDSLISPFLPSRHLSVSTIF